MAENLSESFTIGELRSVCSILAVVVVEWISRLVSSSSSSSTVVENNIFGIDVEKFSAIGSSLHSLVALSGSIACIVVCAATCGLGSTWMSLRMLFNILGPLLVVEATLYSVNYDISSQSIIDSIHFPLSIAWLLEFLMEIENGYPRYWGLFYWVMILVMSSLPTYHILSLPSQKISVVVTRKWFHFIAVLLFGPVTLQFPQLMTLAYAIALCVLIVLETLRREIPMLQSFYVTFIDDTKDDGNHIIISHMFLILGCAAPLWISQSVVINNTQQFSSSTLLLAEFGVICIGVGDAMGAVIGKGIGRHKWGKNQRTLEGSLAMWLSMIWLGSYTCHSFEEYRALIVATTFTTILEAFTVQLDNLALPLVGSTIILLNLQQPSC